MVTTSPPFWGKGHHFLKKIFVQNPLHFRIIHGLECMIFCQRTTPTSQTIQVNLVVFFEKIPF